MVIRWRTDFDKGVVTSNFERRGWERVDSDDEDGEWDVYWASVATVKQMFAAEGGTRLQHGQRVSHFPNHYELTRKDLLVKNLKRYQKLARRTGSPAAEALDMIPATFVLPQDYMLFVEEFRRNTSTAWIMKPSGKSQGHGIFLINKLSQVKKWSNQGGVPPALRSTGDTYVVSRYIDNPLLVGGKKFDLRLYVVVTSYRPLQVYMSKLGFARFCNVKYTTEVDELDNEFVHLTNVAIQKQGADYNDRHGNKWPLADLHLYLQAMRGTEATAKLFRWFVGQQVGLHTNLWVGQALTKGLTKEATLGCWDIEGVVVNSLKACQAIMINDRHCFELYGYDVIVDDTLKPWLIEVNASPSLSATTASDRLLKFKVINDTLNIITLPEWAQVTDPGALPADLRGQDICSGPRQRVGSMHLLCDEAVEQAGQRASRRGRAVA